MPDSVDSPDTLKLSLIQLKDVIKEFLDKYLSGKSPETVGTYRRSLNEFQRWFARPQTTFQFREDDVREYKRYLSEERELSDVSVSTYLTAVRQLCQFLVDAGRLMENPARGVKGNRRPDSHSRKVLTEMDIERLLNVLPHESPIEKRDRAMVYLMLYGGLSEVELVRADHEDLERTLMGWFLRVQGKGRKVKDQQVPLDEEIAEKLQSYLQSRDDVEPESPLFISHGYRSYGKRLKTRSVRSRVNDYLKEADIKRPGISPHSLTHTAPLIWLNRGVGLDEVKSRMRHGTIDTTMIHYKKQGLLTKDPKDLEEMDL